MYLFVWLVHYICFCVYKPNMFQDDASDSASTRSGSLDEDILGNYMCVF